MTFCFWISCGPGCCEPDVLSKHLRSRIVPASHPDTTRTAGTGRWYSTWSLLSRVVLGGKTIFPRLPGKYFCIPRRVVQQFVPKYGYLLRFLEAPTNVSIVIDFYTSQT